MTDRLTFASTITAEGRRLKGEVLLAGQRTPRNGELVEIDPAAFMRADAADAVMVVGHQAGVGMETLGYDPLRTVARASNGSMRLNRTESGFTYETDALPNTAAANDLLALAEAKLLGGTSFDVVGMRSKFSSTPDGTRVRTFSFIQAITAITPVIDPAFPSTVAAFSKESEVTEPIVEEPKVTPPPPAAPEPKAQFSEQPKSGKDQWVAFAKELPTEQIEAGIKMMFTESGGDLSGEILDRYEGFAAELQSRRQNDATSKRRLAEIKFRHDAITGNLKAAPEAGLYESDDYKAAFTKYLRNGDKVVMEQFAQSIAGDGTQGGYMVPDGFLARIVETQKAYGGIARVADSITTSDGIPLRWASNDDTANVASIAAEGSAGSTGADKVFGEVTLGAFSYDATGASNLPLKVSKELLQDAAFDVESFIGRNLGTRIGRKQAADFATGDGSGKPTGLLAKTPDVMSATTLLAALIEHHFQVDAAYRDAGNCKWVLSDTTLAKAYGSVDGNGRPLFIPEAQSGGSDRPAGMLLGYPVIIDNGAANLVAFGDIRQGFIIRYVKGVQVDVDPYTYISTRQIGFHAWARADSNIQDAAAYSVSDYTSVNADS